MDPKKTRYYFYTAKSFTEDHFESDEDAITAGEGKTDCIRIMRARDSADIWTKPTATAEPQA